MSTRSAIIERLPDGTYRGVYCHLDGYLEGVGHMLSEHYRDPAKVSRLIDLGSISSLGENIDPGRGRPHTYDEPQDGVTVAYKRDRGEGAIDIVLAKSVFAVAAQIGHNGHVYVFENGEWLHNGEVIAPVAVTKPKDSVLRCGWFFGESRDDESWNGPHETREEAIEEGRANYAGERETFWIDSGDLVTVDDALGYFDLDRIGEGIEEHLYDNDIDSGDPMVSWRDEPAALAALQEWARAHLVIARWYTLLGDAKEIRVNAKEET